MEKIQEKIVKELIKARLKSPGDLHSFKRRSAKKFKIDPPTNIELLKAYHSLFKNKRIKKHEFIEYLLKTRRVRSLSGIVNVSVLLKSYPCSGKCIFCPAEKGMPKSYLSKEPAVQRAVLSGFDPKKQVKSRIRALEITGHPTDKIELRIIGGTWGQYPEKYRNWFVKQCFMACNNSKKENTLEEEQKKNEKAKKRIIGITVETRPDYINEKEIKRMRKLGITRVELGVQSVYDDILRMNRRGHSAEDTARATRILKDAGFKVSYQMMPNLLGADLKRDAEMFRILFEDQRFKPDLLKIYPTGLIKNTPLYKKYKMGEYMPYTEKELTDLLIKIKKQIPYYVRIERIIRDIPSEEIIEGGVKRSNLREEIKGRVSCKCIRCREVGERKNQKPFLFREDYESSEGKEVFLSFEDKERKQLYALLRLRISKEKAIIREIHTYGQLIPVSKDSKAVQHKGLGKKLMAEAERISAKEFNLKKISVISGVGTREYYRKLGYELENTYMVKSLKP